MNYFLWIVIYKISGSHRESTYLYERVTNKGARASSGRPTRPRHIGHYFFTTHSLSPCSQWSSANGGEMGARKAGKREAGGHTGPQRQAVLSLLVDFPPHGTAPSIFQYQEIHLTALQNLWGDLRHYCEIIISTEYLLRIRPAHFHGSIRQSNRLGPQAAASQREGSVFPWKAENTSGSFTYKTNMGISITYLHPKGLWEIVVEPFWVYLIWILPKQELIASESPFLCVYVLSQELSCESKFWLKHFFKQRSFSVTLLLGIALPFFWTVGLIIALNGSYIHTHLILKITIGGRQFFYITS